MHSIPAVDIQHSQPKLPPRRYGSGSTCKRTGMNEEEKERETKGEGQREGGREGEKEDEREGEGW